MKNNKASRPGLGLCTQITRQGHNYYFIMTSATRAELLETQIFQQICKVEFAEERNIFLGFG